MPTKPNSFGYRHAVVGVEHCSQQGVPHTKAERLVRSTLHLLSPQDPAVLHCLHLHPSFLLIFLLAIACSAQLWGQGPAMELGVRGETGVGIGPQRLPGTPACPDCETDGTTTERRINFSAGLFFPNGLNDAFGFRLRVGGTFVTGTSISNPYTAGIAVDSSGTPIPAELEYAIEYSPTQLQFEFLGEYAPASWARLFAGPWGVLRLNDPYIQTERIRQPANAQFIAGGNQRTVASGSEVAPARGTFGLAVGGGIRWRVAPRISLLPDLFARLALDVRNDIIGFSTLAVGGGIGLQVDLLPPAEPSLPSDTATPPPQPIDTAAAPPPPDTAQVASAARLLPTATIDLFAVDSAGNPAQTARLGAQLIRHIRATMIPPTLRCDQLPLMIAAAQAATPQWTLDSLARADHPMVRRQLLLAFAARLRQTPSAQLVIGSGNRECRDSLRALLVGKLQIEPATLAMPVAPKQPQQLLNLLATGEGGKALLAPITNEWFIEDIQEPTFSVRPTMAAPAGVRQWSIVVKQAERTITSRSSTEQSGVPPSPMLLRQPDGGAPPPLVALFTVEDSAGGSVTAVDTLPVLPPVSPPAGQQPNRWDREEIDILLQTTKAPSGAPDWKQVLGGYIPAIQQGAQIMVAGTASEGRQVLAQLRAMLRQASQAEIPIELVEKGGKGEVQVLVRQQKRH